MGSPAASRTFAAIDVGSHTLRLIIAQLGDDQVLTPVCLERRVTRLARGFGPENRLSAAGIEVAMAALAEYAALSWHYGAERIACGATGVVRRASNGRAFIEGVESVFGFRACILSESEEALHSARGILSVLSRRSRPILTFDLGGSTTELLLVDGRNDGATWSTSVFVGAATLTEAWMEGDPPDRGSIQRACEAARASLAPAFEALCGLLTPSIAESSLQLVGTAGTVTTLAAMRLGMTHYEPYRVNGLVLTDDWLQEAIDHLASASLAERREIPGLEPGREDIILAGALIVREVMTALGRRELTVTDGGLLEGLLIDLVERAYGWPQGIETSLRWHFES